MPVQYSGVLAEHRAVREQAGLFDVSHMGEIEFSGHDVIAFLERAFTNNVLKLKTGDAQYTLMLNDEGGVVDDLILYCMKSGSLYMAIVNASNIEKDVSRLQAYMQQWECDVTIKNVSEKLGLFAVQGPNALEIVKSFCGDAFFNEVRTVNDFEKMMRFTFQFGNVRGVNLMLARTGYTGEDGFELCFENEHAHLVWNHLLEVGKDMGLAPVGLGARDTLRLEMGYALYGHELREDVNPFEANLHWVVKMNKEFVGKSSLEACLKQKRRLVGFVIDSEKVVLRQGAIVEGLMCINRDRYADNEWECVGAVCSGGYSPTLEKPIGTALISTEKESSELRDVLRATTTITAALMNGAKEVVPCDTLEELNLLKAGYAEGTYVTGGEKDYAKVPELALGNSPQSYAGATVSNKTVLLLTTNGTLTIKKASLLGNVCLVCFNNVSAIREHLLKSDYREKKVYIVCSGKNGMFASEDFLCAGLLVDKLVTERNTFENFILGDAANVARVYYEKFRGAYEAGLVNSESGRQLISKGMQMDVDFCAKVDTMFAVPVFQDGAIRLEKLITKKFKRVD
ncbi:hypothetical protein CHS0354_024144 [Potamilus streckersoni]|uniref:aminomethyltransferase n=1 Tax=Potamilus streckersoni TaxID=2493646 RepID=A0AAE0RZV2_9BIVA|nr:hypothetical protein CHS0354_024144 [Potamilus streckersoni]